jgi:anoctamin-7
MLKYSEMMIQLGYIVMFAQVFPLAPFFSIICNFIEIKSNMDMLAYYSVRFQAEGSSGIGVWKNITEVILLRSYVNFRCCPF